MALAKLRWLGFLALMFMLSGCGSNPNVPVIDLSPLDRRNSQYTVNDGDTLHAISFRTGVSYQNLAKWNGISPPYRIYVGDVLDLRAGADPKQRTTAQTPKTPQTAPARRTQPTKPALASKPLPVAKLPSNVSSWQWPAKGKLTKTFSRKNAQYGIEIKGNRSSAVVSTAAGQVVYAGNGIKGYGELVIVKHSARYISAYAYNDRILVKEGDRVKAGQQLANMGSTGTRGVKLHFEIRKNGEPVNPLQYLPLQSG
jgi:lipoprotein NlpD